MTWQPTRTALDADATRLVDRLCELALRGLPHMYRAADDQFVFTRAEGLNGKIELRGTSNRYAAIVALGAYWCSEEQQRQILGGHSVDEFITVLVKRLPTISNLGDVALVCWAAAQSAHPALRVALARLRELDSDPTKPQYVVEAAWVVSALATARKQAEVEAPLALARDRLLGSLRGSSPLFPHATAPGLVPWYRSHVSCFADQVYPIQALARLHTSADDPVAFRASIRCADRICEVQGDGGQWWWHYDANAGTVVEGYPVYSVHQHAMAPMALLDLTDAGGPQYRENIERGLRWLTEPAELRGRPGEEMLLDDQGLTWRKIYRGDPRKVVRAVQGATTRAVRNMHVPGLNLVYPPSKVDRECRPYEFGWLLFTWLNNDAR